MSRVHECSSEEHVLFHLELIIKNLQANSRLWEGGVSVTSHSVTGSPFLLRSPFSSRKDQMKGEAFGLGMACVASAAKKFKCIS